MALLNFWIPTTGKELETLANVLADSQKEAKELIRCHAWFGHFFGGHLGKVQANVSVIHGKPCLLSDALVGICYSKGLVRRFQVMESNNEFCTVEAERTDEPAGVIHRFTFTMEMARNMKLVKASWNTQRENMLKKRCRNFICREVFPEAVSGLYSIDEIADFSNLSEKQHAEAVARSLGYDDEASARSARPEAMPAPKPTPAPQPISAPKPTPAPQPELSNDNSIYDFETEEKFYTACNDNEINIEEVNTAARKYKLNIATASPVDRSRFFYSVIIHDVIRRAPLLPALWQDESEEQLKTLAGAFAHQYPILKDIPISWYKYRIVEPAFVESIRLTNDLSDDGIDKAIKAISSHDPTDWRLYDYIQDLANN